MNYSLELNSKIEDKSMRLGILHGLREEFVVKGTTNKGEALWVVSCVMKESMQIILFLGKKHNLFYVIQLLPNQQKMVLRNMFPGLVVDRRLQHIDSTWKEKECKLMKRGCWCQAPPKSTTYRIKLHNTREAKLFHQNDEIY